MNMQRFHLKINLKLEAVTCPGVWLCSHGYLEVTIKVLGYFFRTGAMDPYFPLLCHDVFKMEGYFKNAKSVAQVVNNLSRENLAITLWQNSRRLAYYEGKLVDLLQYMQPKLQCPHTNTRQLLMKTTTAFPGIIAPKVEVATHFIINDNFLNICNTLTELRTYTGFRKNPTSNEKSNKDKKPIQYRRPCSVQTPTSEASSNRQNMIRKQKTVCHTRDLNNASKKLSISSIYTKSPERCVSIASSCFSDNTHTSVGIRDLEHDGNQSKTSDYNHNHADLCELCRLYRDIFLNKSKLIKEC